MEKKHFQDDYVFGMRQVKGLKLSEIILKHEYGIIHNYITFWSSKVKQVF